MTTESFQFQADVDRLLEDGSLDENVESFLSQDDMDPRDSLGRSMDASKGILISCWYLAAVCNQQES